MQVGKTYTYKTKLQEFIHEYKQVVNDRPVTAREVAAWALREGKWKPSRQSALDQLAKELARAAREEYMTDLQGRRVRRLHARRVDVQLPSGEWKQETFWDDITTASPEHMHMAFQQRRGLVLSDCHQLKNDMDSYNENWNQGQQLELIYDFTEDLEEMDMPTEYPKDDKDEDQDGSEGDKDQQ